MKKIAALYIFGLAWLLAGTQPAVAYVGPGLGLGAIGAILGVALSVLLAIFAVVWYPVKRLLGLDKKLKAKPGPGKKAD